MIIGRILYRILIWRAVSNKYSVRVEFIINVLARSYLNHNYEIIKTINKEKWSANDPLEYVHNTLLRQQ